MTRLVPAPDEGRPIPFGSLRDYVEAGAPLGGYPEDAAAMADFQRHRWQDGCLYGCEACDPVKARMRT